MQETAIDVSDWINRQKLSSLQICVIVLSALTAMLEGFDALNIGFVAPALVKQWHVPPQAFTPAFMAGLAGLLVGCLAIAPLADRFGRRSVMIASVIAFGVFSLLSAASQSLASLVLLRFLTGLGVAGGMANAIALTSEFFPERTRTGMTAAMFLGFPLGSSLGGYLSGWLLPRYGWPSVFIAGGLLPIAIAPALILLLPESIRHLVGHGAAPARIKSVLLRLDPTAEFPPDARFVLAEERKSGATVRHLFGAGRTLGTLLLWTVFFLAQLVIFMTASWTPLVLHGMGLPVSTAVYVQSTLALSGAIAVLVTAPVLNRYGCCAVLAPAFLLSAGSLAALGNAPPNVPLLLLIVAGVGAGNIASQNTANALAAKFYPTYIRATGIGWAMGIGRLGAIAGPAVGGAMFTFHLDPQALFLVAAVPPLVSCGAALVLVRLEARPGAKPRALAA